MPRTHDPPYVRIAGDIRRRIVSGELPPGARVPSTRAIVRRWRVAMATATKVLALLRQDGLVRTVPGAGTVVVGAGGRARVAPAGRRKSAQPGPSPLSLEGVVRAAIAVADAEGIDAVSMRRIATELGVATMALYRHVAGKDELVAQMAEKVFGEPLAPESRARGWRSQLELLAREQWAGYARHPWLAPVISISFSRPTAAPNGMAHTERALRALTGLDLDATTRLHVAVTLIGYVQGTALKLLAENEAQQHSGLSASAWMAAHEAALARVLSSGAFPQLAALATDGDVDLSLDTLFEFGLGTLLDGYAVLFASNAARAKRRPVTSSGS